MHACMPVLWGCQQYRSGVSESGSLAHETGLKLSVAEVNCMSDCLQLLRTQVIGRAITPSVYWSCFFSGKRSGNTLIS